MNKGSAIQLSVRGYNVLFPRSQIFFKNNTKQKSVISLQISPKLLVENYWVELFIYASHLSVQVKIVSL